MESRGLPVEGRPNGRPTIARRSCDQCRARKIGCDRGSPCSNCLSARVDCTHSAVASKPTTAKQRVLISAHYEKKIDDIARDVDGIKHLLEGLNVPGESPRVPKGITPQPTERVNDPPVGHHRAPSSVTIPSWDHSVHVIDFIKAVVDDDATLKDKDPESSQVLSSLKNLVNALENPDVPRLAPNRTKATTQAKSSMPPLESVVQVLRWAKAHESYTRIFWICKMLPLDKFEEICCKVYFAINDYSEAEFIIANGFLSYIFAEHAVVYGIESSREHSYLCRSNVDTALQLLPMLLPASMEVVAALTLGALQSIEDSKTSMAGTLISAALSHCQTLGYHRLGLARGDEGPLRIAKERLFWAVYSIENGLSLRLGRSSGIRDTDIILAIDPDEPRSTKIARIQKKVYEQLYSPAGLASSPEKRIQVAQELSNEARVIVDASRADISGATGPSEDPETDPMRLVYFHCGLVCQSSLLVLILRALPPDNKTSGVSESCVAAARDTLDMHRQCMKLVRDCKDPLLVRKYINWALLHTPFVPFSILFTRAVQLLDLDDLSRLERFAASLKPEAGTESPTHPHRLYELLSQAARLYIDSKLASSLPSTFDLASFPDVSDYPEMMTETGTAMQAFEPSDYPMFDLGDWYYGNQHLMSLLDEHAMF
ncbi:hypothetical protein ACJ41O_009002 [Fusarium nematophilum]